MKIQSSRRDGFKISIGLVTKRIRMTLVSLKCHELGMWIMMAGNVIAYEVAY